MGWTGRRVGGNRKGESGIARGKHVKDKSELELVGELIRNGEELEDARNGKVCESKVT